jgi:C-terminal processing protease CtpA/Prc
VRAALASFVGRGARGLVIDLRSALGGIGEADIASALCDGDIVYFVQQPLTGTPSPVARQGTRLWPRRPIAFLVNEQTVSAGEDLVLAVRELAPSTVVVGRTTAGGLTEFEPVPLGAGHALIVPTGAVLGPVTRRAPPGYAIVPDVPLDGPTTAELLAGRDPELDAAQASLARRAESH